MGGSVMAAAVQPLRVAPDPTLEPLDAEAVAERVLDLLEQRGVPSGAWLVDIAQVRRALRDADGLLRRLEEAVIRSAGG
jgi:hypothetical protein